MSRSGNNPGRVKRVVSCKRKTHHLTVVRKKQLGSGRNYDAANKENEMNCIQDMKQEIFDMDLWDLPLNVNNNDRTGRTGSEQTEYATLTEVRNDIVCPLCYGCCKNYFVTNIQIKLTQPCVFQLTRDHNTMTNVLFGRHLRLKVALTLWHRNIGELLTYFLRYKVCSWFDACYTWYCMLFTHT